MADFEQTRDELSKGRENTEKAHLDLYASGHRLRVLEQESKDLDRQKGDNNETYIRRRRELDRKIAAEKAAQAINNEKYTAARDRLSGVERQFELFTDPRRELEAHFSNETPFLLF